MSPGGADVGVQYPKCDRGCRVSCTIANSVERQAGSEWVASERFPMDSTADVGDRPFNLP
jgi:hypothetical protein